MSDLMRFPSAAHRDSAIDAWFGGPGDALRWIARPWFEQMRACGADVRELLHAGHPTACVADAALADPDGLLEGTGKRMRHVKLRWARPVNAAALSELIAAAYRDMRLRLDSDQG